MKRIQFISIVLLFVIIASAFSAHKRVSPTPNFYSHYLLLNGQPLDVTSFSLLSFGKLELVEGSLITKETKQVPFRIFIRREGVVQTDGLAQYDREYTNIAIQSVLASARPGDELIIEPAHKSDHSSRRIIKLNTYQWLRIKSGKSDGC